MFLFVASFMGKISDFVERRTLTRESMVHTEIVGLLLFNQNRAACSRGELASLRWEISKFRALVGKMFAPHCSSGLFTLSFNLVYHAAKSLGKFGVF